MNLDPSVIIPCKGYIVTRPGPKENTDEAHRVTRLNVGCGRYLYKDCVNLDLSDAVNPDVVWDVTRFPWPFEDDTFDSAYCSHLLEHLEHPLPFMQELARVCAPNAIAMFKLPYGSSDNAWEDPTHKRMYFIDSFGYFSQAAYANADYGYRGDWTVKERELRLMRGKQFHEYNNDLPQLLGLVMTHRNVVEEFKVVVQNVKPPRNPNEAREAAPISFFIPQESKESTIVVPPSAKH